MYTYTNIMYTHIYTNTYIYMFVYICTYIYKFIMFQQKSNFNFKKKNPLKWNGMIMKV